MDRPAPDRTVKRRLQDAGDAALSVPTTAIFSTVAKLVEAPKHAIPEGDRKVSAKKKPCTLGASCYDEPNTKGT